MVQLFLNNKEVLNFKDWSLYKDIKSGQIILSVEYYSGKKFKKAIENWHIVPCYEVAEDLLYNNKSKSFSQIESAVAVGEKYLLYKYLNSTNIYIINLNEVEISKSTNIKSGDIFKYYKSISEERVLQASGEKKAIAENINRQFNKIVAYHGTALNAYLTKKVEKRMGFSSLIFPFGINESQLKAVTKAFESQISVIEGPPGTGKTQTILNIISNIIANGNSCAIVSNNNPAVINVYEKLEKMNLDFLVAKLGNDANKKAFFESINYCKPEKCDNVDIQAIDSTLNTLRKYLKVKNDYAKVVSEIDEIKIEKKYLQDWYNDALIKDSNFAIKSKSSTKTVELIAYLRTLPDSPLTLLNKINLIFNYRVFNSHYLDTTEQRLLSIFRLQLSFYEKRLEEKNREKLKLEKMLDCIDYDNTLECLKENSLSYLYNYIDKKMPNKLGNFNEDTYLKHFADFIKAFPIIGSSTHSLLNSLANGTVLDYVIIDEASQQDLVPGILCLACAKNIIIVGDRKQLPHIPIATKLKCPNELYDCEKYSLLDSICEVFKDVIPRTLLKEHYRCHPKIIQYCNKQFYDNQLIPMTKDNGEEALSLVITALGNHTRKNANLREIESIIKTHEVAGYLKPNLGFIAPYNAQIKLANEILAAEIKKDTIHKFQGRECDEIIFSTVLDKKASSKAQLNFVDNSSLVNVAVSRAIHKFTLVTGNNVFANNNKYIASLIRYIKYYANNNEIYESPVISAFDLLYKEYDRSLDNLLSKLRKKDSKYKSEQIVSALLRDILKQEDFNSLIVYKQVLLKQLVKINKDFTKREVDFINNGASCDFGIYYHMGKAPIAVIEVDGGYHDLPKQKERDQVKNEILNKGGIPLLRLPTTSSNIEEKIIEHLRKCILSIDL